MANKYVTPAGAGAKDGTNWANAFGLTEFVYDYTNAGGTLAPGDIYYFEGSGATYTFTSITRPLISGSYTEPIKLIGIADIDTMRVAVLESECPIFSFGAFYLYFTGRIMHFKYGILMTGTGVYVLNYSADVTLGFYLENVYVRNISTGANKTAINCNEQAYYVRFRNCFASTLGSSGVAFNAFPSRSSVEGCVAEAPNGGTGFQINASGRNLIARNCGVGIILNSFTSQPYSDLTVHNCSVAGISTSATVRLLDLRNISISNTPIGIRLTNAIMELAHCKFENINFYNCTKKLVANSVESNEFLGVSCTQLDPQFVDADNGNFAIGPNLRSKGFSNKFPNLNTTSYVDIGAVQIREVLPEQSEVLAGVKYGANGTELTGTLATGGALLDPINVRFGIDRGDGVQGLLQSPSTADVRRLTAYGANSEYVGTAYIPVANDVRNGVNTDDTVGNIQLPLESNVASGVGYGSNGTELTGTYACPTPNLPSENDVRNGVEFGEDLTGNLILPSEADVKEGIGYGSNGEEFVGEFAGVVPDYPAESDVRNDVEYASGFLVGNLTLPTENNVKKDIQYGAEGEEYTGSLEKITIDDKAMVSIFNNDRINVGVR